MIPFTTGNLCLYVIDLNSPSLPSLPPFSAYLQTFVATNFPSALFFFSPPSFPVPSPLFPFPFKPCV